MPGSISTLEGRDYFPETHLELTDGENNRPDFLLCGVSYLTFLKDCHLNLTKLHHRGANQPLASLGFHSIGKSCMFLLSNLGAYDFFVSCERPNKHFSTCGLLKSSIIKSCNSYKYGNDFWQVPWDFEFL